MLCGYNIVIRFEGLQLIHLVYKNPVTEKRFIVLAAFSVKVWLESTEICKNNNHTYMFFYFIN